jgi:hypothetical protein
MQNDATPVVTQVDTPSFPEPLSADEIISAPMRALMARVKAIPTCDDVPWVTMHCTQCERTMDVVYQGEIACPVCDLRLNGLGVAQ